MIKRWLITLLADEITKEVETQLLKIQNAEIEAELDDAVDNIIIMDRMQTQIPKSAKLLHNLATNVDKMADTNITMSMALIDLHKRLKAIEETDHKVLH